MIPACNLPSFRNALLSWFRRHQRDLPWRRSKDPYRIWLSEIMLQQTRVAAVIPYYEKFVEHFPDVQALARAPEEDVLRLWAGLGYYSRARNLQQAARIVVAKHGGLFPQVEAEVLALPGIGNYTAAAILSIAFGAKHAVLDGNVARVLARLGAIRGDLREGPRWLRLQKFADELLESEFASDWNQGMMELGAMICTPRSPQCLLCPVSQYCSARELGLTESIPERRIKRATVKVALAIAIFVDGKGRTLLLPPPRGKGSGKSDDIPALLSKMWHFPTIAVKKDAAKELRIHLAKMLGARSVRALQMVALSPARHAVTFRSVTIFPYRIKIVKLPRIAGTKITLLSELASNSSVAISNLTRKAASAAIASIVRTAKTALL
ncbi:MAG TPA: A/G-specific adenine glycosylase [Candidatus Acidoferrum sp.]|jgi:A/G-specific adenine glycosylase